MEAISADLHLHTVSRGDWTNFSWLLRRKGGNLLVACADVSDILPEIEKLGGLSRVLLTDIHFANAWHGKVANHFGATLVCHESDKAKVKTRCKAAKLEALGARTQLEKDLLALHTPGHADGGLCYFWAGGKTATLFTGDFLCHTAKGWAVFCGQAKRKTMAKSLALVGELGVELLCPGVSQGEPYHSEAQKKGQWPKLIADVTAEYAS
ncbi:MAG: hypothetical protein KF754_06855 [Planctomycetes bacterium]|nr:hypothetical protein [Planctomycetota bacterium]